MAFWMAYVAVRCRKGRRKWGESVGLVADSYGEAAARALAFDPSSQFAARCVKVKTRIGQRRALLDPDQPFLARRR